MALIHVIIPVYNAKRFLAETVASVLNQPCKDIDIVLVNDGSTDGSAALCDEIAAREDRVTVIHQENGGVSRARNAGIEFFLRNQAQGYVAFLDSDDLWCPNVFTVEMAERILRDQADIIGFSSCSANAEASQFRILGKYENKTLTFEENNQTSFLWAQGTFAAHLYHVRLLLQMKFAFDPLCKQNEDVIFAAKMLFCAQKITLFDLVLYVYRTNPASVTHTVKYTQDNARHIPDAWYNARTYFAESTDVSEDAKEKWFHFCLETSAVRCLEMAKLLAMDGCTYAQIDDCFGDREYYRHIGLLHDAALAPWQREDLKMFQKNPEAFCADYRKRGLASNIRSGVLRLPFVRKLLDNRRFTLSWDEINQQR